ncbi:hypothetical protein P8C59_005725 [Phyllachora maydis]|uniref:Carboxylic ester hydrolase n=1 Tax=Phyllachora maydis TaxID=1825666 RepID=A0AAD9I600_9PEZI|nr:hypothetical protein P8C59_005725 [Phyllachora maydis]
MKTAALGLLAASLLGLHAAARPAPESESESVPYLEPRANPSVTIASGTVIGAAMPETDNWGGIPFAQPPTGPLRLKPPVKAEAIGTFDATGAAGACPQMAMSTAGKSLLLDVLGDLVDLPFFQTAVGESEDCLTVSVARPKGTTADAKLPVLFWIFGGGFEMGWSSMYDGTSLVQNAAALGKPYVFVAVNYRLGGFGFMPGKEVLADGAANLGLLDQRMGLEWVADNIAAFGGDPDRVTLWGESAGAISVFDQMALYGGNNMYRGRPLFRAAILDSGSIVPADPVDCPKGQAVYDTVVAAAGCGGASDTLACLRAADYTTFLDAANAVPAILSYQSLALAYLPRPDGTALPASPEELLTGGRYAAVPLILGDQEDEGTFFALFQSNLSTPADVADYLGDVFFAGATPAQLAALVATYDASRSPAAGSPFRTGVLNQVYPAFKLLAAMLGDLVFTLTRRATLEAHARLHGDAAPTWSYLASYGYGIPVLGTFHASDVLQVFYGILPDYASRATQSYYANFVYNLDPNDASGGTGAASKVAMDWPRWGAGRQLMNFMVESAGLVVDDFRNASYQFIVENTAALHV